MEGGDSLYKVLPVWVEGDQLFVQLCTEQAFSMFKTLMNSLSEYCELGEWGEGTGEKRGRKGRVAASRRVTIRRQPTIHCPLPTAVK